MCYSDHHFRNCTRYLALEFFPSFHPDYVCFFLLYSYVFDHRWSSRPLLCHSRESPFVRRLLSRAFDLILQSPLRPKGTLRAQRTLASARVLLSSRPLVLATTFAGAHFSHCGGTG